ncbi:uncharacterized protein LOC135126940 [Zophobas morio]|uniref:uncharacterized protein LOC135126940 n=1 Tax=Zophobas morio TaxID=2755281 RepID=UPI0030835B42
MITTHILLLFTLTVIPHTPAQNFVPNAQYSHEIIFSNEDLLSQSDSDPEILPLATTSRVSSESDFLPAGNVFSRGPALDSVDLFTPNTVQQPAETPGQIENYRKALEEEAREAERAENAITTVFRDRIGGESNLQPKSYVSVKVGLGNKRYDYGYTV